MKLKSAAQLLSVDLDSATPESIKAAANAAIRSAHPDNGGDPALAPDQIRRAKEARDLLLGHVSFQLTPGLQKCPTCKGTGRLRGKGFAPHECPTCGGDGEIPI